MKKNLLTIGIILGFILGFASCNTDDTCRKNRAVSLGMNFYLDTLTIPSNRLVVLKYSIDTLSVQGLGVDSILYNKSKKINSIQLPLNSFAEESSFIFHFNDKIDTITFFHKNINEFLSLDCGYIRTFKIDSVRTTTYFVDSISITNPSVNTIHVENIQIHHNK